MDSYVRRGSQAVIAALLLLFALAVPVRAAEPGALAPTSIRGFAPIHVTVALGHPMVQRVAVRTGDGYPQRKVQVQRRPADGSGPWQVEYSATTGTRGTFNAVLIPPSPGDWHYRLRVPASADGAAAVTNVRLITVKPNP